MKSILAVAKNTISHALRMKVAVVVIVLLLVLLPLMGVIMVGDGTLKGKLQTFVSYGLSLTTMLLCLLTIIVSIFTVTEDIKRKYIFLVITKPVQRYQLILGKLLGVIILNAVLLAVFATVIYGLTLSIPKFAKADQQQIQQASDEFFSARRSHNVEVDQQKISMEVEKAYKKLFDQNALPEDMNKLQVKRELEKQILQRNMAVVIGATKTWTFEKVKPLSSGDRIFVQYKYEVASNPADLKVHARWFVGDNRQKGDEPGNLKTPIYGIDRSDVIRTIQEFSVPADAVSPDGHLAIEVQNLFINNTTIIPQQVKVLYRAGSFTANYLRVIAVLFMKLIFLACLGMSAATWLSFPVAALISVAVLVVGMVNGFVVESFDTLGQGTHLLYMFTLKPLLWLLPRFDGQYNPAQFMITGDLLEWKRLLSIAGVLICIKAFLLVLFGIWVFSKKEIAKITV